MKRILLYIGGSAVVLIVGFVLWLLSPAGKSTVKHYAFQRLQDATGYRITTERFETNYFSHITLDDIRISDSTTASYAEVSHMKIQYRLFPTIRGSLTIDSLISRGIDVQVQHAFLNRFVSGQQDHRNEQRRKSRWTLQIRHIDIRNTSITYAYPEKQIAAKMEEVDISYAPNDTMTAISGNIYAKYQGKEVDQFRLQCKAAQNDETWNLVLLQLESAMSKVAGQGSAVIRDEWATDFQLEGMLGQDILSVLQSYLPEKYADRMELADVHFSGDTRLTFDSIGYTGTLRTDSIVYDTIAIRNPRLKFSGDRNGLAIQGFRTVLGSDMDTLSLSGEYDWFRKYAELQINGHFTSLDYVRHFFETDVPVNSSVDIALTAEVPYTDLSNSTGRGTVTFSSPVVNDRYYSPVETHLTVSKIGLSARTKYRSNTVEITGNLDWPFRFTGELHFNDFAEIDSVFTASIRPEIQSEFTGVIGEPGEPFQVDGQINTTINAGASPDVQVFPAILRLPFTANSSAASVHGGTFQVGSLQPARINSEVQWKPEISGTIEIQEPVKTEGSDAYGVLRAHLSGGDTLYNGSLRVENLSLARWSQILPRTQKQVAGNFNIYSEFSVGSSGIKGAGELRLTNGQFANSELDSARIGFEWDGKGISLVRGRGYSKQLSASIAGYLPFTARGSLRLNLQGERWPLDVANPFLPETIEIAGVLNPSISLTGSYLHPEINGKVEVDTGYFSWNTNQPPVQDFQARITFSDSTYDIEFAEFRYTEYPVRISGNGTLKPSFTGDVSIEPAGRIGINYSAESNHSIIADLNNFPIQIASPYFPVELSNYGYLNGKIIAKNLVDNLTFKTDGVWSPEQQDQKSEWEYQWDANYSDSRLKVDKSVLQTSAGIVKIGGSVPLDIYGGGVSQIVQDDTLAIDVQIQELKATAVNSFTDKVQGNSGAINSDFHIGGTWNYPSLSGFFRGSGLDFQSPLQQWQISDGSFDLVFRDRGLVIRSIDATINGYPVTMDGAVKYGHNYQVDAKIAGEFNRKSPFEFSLVNDTSEDTLYGGLAFRDVQITDILDIMNRQQDMRGELNFTLGVQGSRSDPFIHFTGDIDRLAMDEIVFNHANFTGNYNDGWIAIDTLMLTKASAHIRGDGRLSAHLNLQQFSLGRFAQRIDFNLRAQSFPIESFDVLSAADNNIAGILNANFRYQQGETAKTITGYAALERLALDLPYFEQKIQDGSAQLEFSGNSIWIRKGQLSVDKKPVRLSGNVGLSPNSPPVYDVAIKTERIKLSRKGEVSMTLAPSELHILTRTGAPAYLEGAIQFQSFDYTKKIANPQMLSLIGTRTIRPQQFTAAMLEDIRLNLAIQMLKGASVQNNLADLNFTADIQLNGPLFNPRYSGRITANDGEIYYLRRTFTIREADVFFAGTPEMNPDLNITAVATVPAYQNVDEIDYRITMNIINTLRQPRVRLSSDPAVRPHTGEQLTQSDIIGILAVGRPREQFSGVAGEGNITEVLRRQAEQFSSEKIASAMEYRVGRLLDLDRVTIEGNLFNMSGAQTPTFTAQKQLSTRLSLTYSSAIGNANEQGVRLNYQLSPHWYLVTETSQQEDYGVDIKYRIRFK